MMNRQRVVVTGMGTVNPLGSTVSRFWERCVKGASGVGTVTAFPIPEHMSRIAGMVQGPGEHELRTIFDDVDEAARLDRSLVFALLATRSAISDAGLGSEDLSGDGPARNAVVISTAIAQIARMELAFCRQTGMGSRPIGPPRSRTKGGCNNFFFNTTSGELARFFGINGRAVTTATGCTGGVDALGHAFQLIRSGKVELVIAGAAEAPITPLVVAAFSKIGATSLRNHAPAEASRPFDRDRDGFVLAEGCAIVVLESLEHALERGARIYAEITGFSSVNNHYHMTDIPEDGSSIARSCSAALADAGIDAEAVDFVNAHGSSTPQNDVAEANALRLVFGRDPDPDADVLLGRFLHSPAPVYPPGGSSFR